MKYDQTFARFARRMIKYTTVAIIGFAFISEFIWDWLKKVNGKDKGKLLFLLVKDFLCLL